MEYTMSCDDGFTVRSKDKEEVANMVGMHMMTMHPEAMISGEEMMKKVKTVKKAAKMEM